MNNIEHYIDYITHGIKATTLKNDLSCDDFRTIFDNGSPNLIHESNRFFELDILNHGRNYCHDPPNDSPYEL